MIDLTTDIRHERAVLIGVATPDTPFEKMNEYLTELAFLVDTAGGVAVRKIIQNLPHPDPRTYLGSGKL
jgi:GTP-binding protein HflX